MRRTERRGQRTAPESKADRTGRTQSSAFSPQSSSTLCPQSFEIHIEELVLHGFPPGDRYRIEEAFERQLAALFFVPHAAVSQHATTIDRIDGGTFHLRAGDVAESVAAHVARVIYTGYTRVPR